MARIMNVDYEAIPGQAQQMRSLGQELNSELTTAYQSIADMHNAWYGKRYNELVKSFNNIIPQINEMLQLVVGDIPFSLESIANNYSQTEDGYNITSAQQTAPSKVSELGPYSEGAEDKMRYISADVETTKNQIVSDFDNAKSKMEAIKSVYDQTPWDGDASEAYSSTLTRLKNEIITSFENITTQFTNLMNQAEADVNAAETGNTVS